MSGLAAALVHPYNGRPVVKCACACIVQCEQLHLFLQSMPVLPTVGHLPHPRTPGPHMLAREQLTSAILSILYACPPSTTDADTARPQEHKIVRCLTGHETTTGYHITGFRQVCISRTLVWKKIRTFQL